MTSVSHTNTQDPTSNDWGLERFLNERFEYTYSLSPRGFSNTNPVI